MNESGGTITVTLKMDNKQFLATAAASDVQGQALGDKLDKNTKAATDRTAARFATLGGAIKTGLGIGVIAAGAAGLASIKMAGDFQQSMNILQSVSGATGKQFAELSAKARELGKDASLPGVSAADAANAMSELAKAGLSVNDVLGASKGVLSLAKAGQLDTADAATITARALNTFGLEGREANKVADLLAAGANSSTAGVQDMAEALAQGGAGARQFGISVNDTVTALALFSNAGINGSDAGTSLKTMLQRLAAPTDQSAAAMKKLGLNFFDAQGNFVGLEATAGQLSKALGGLTTEQKNAALATIFGSDSSRVAAVLANEGAKGFDKMAKAVNKQGAATDLAKAQNSGFKGALDNLMSTLETIGTDLGTKVLPPLTKLLQVLANNAEPVVDWFIANGKTLAIVIAGLGTAFASVRVAGFISDFSKAQKTLSLFVGAKNATGILALGNAFKTMGGIAVTVIRAVGAAILANPIIAAIAAIIAVLVFLQVKFNIFGKLFKAIRPILASVGNFFVKTFQTIATAVGTAIDAIVAFWNAKLKPVFDVMITIITTIFTIYVRIWAAILLVIVGTLAIIASVIWSVMQAIWGVISSVWNAIWSVISAIIGFITARIVAAFNFYWTIISTVLGAIWGVVSKVWNAIYSVISKIVGAIASVISRVFNTVKGYVSSAWNAVYGTISGALGRIWSAVSGTLGRVASFFGNIGSKIVGAFKGAGSWLYDAGKNLINGLLKGAGSLLSTIGNFFLEKLPGPIRGAFKKALGIHSPSTVFAGYGKNIVEGLAVGLNKNASTAVRAAQSLGDSVASIGSSVSTPSGSIGLTDAQLASTPDSSAGGATVINVKVDQSGILARSRADLRDIGEDIVSAINEGRRARGAAMIGGANG